MGNKTDLDYEKIRKITGSLSRYINNMNVKKASIIIPGENNNKLKFNETADAVSLGFLIGSYKYDKYKTKKSPNSLQELTLLNTSGQNISHDLSDIINESESINLIL